MKELFIPYTEAVELAQLGFDEKVLAHYINDNGWLADMSVGSLYLKSRFEKDSGDYTIPAPTFSQSFKFFREKYNFDLNWKSMSMVGITCYHNVEIHHPKYVWDKPPTVTGKTYEEAELECLKKLIKIVKDEKK